MIAGSLAGVGRYNGCNGRELCDAALVYLHCVLYCINCCKIARYILWWLIFNSRKPNLLFSPLLETILSVISLYNLRPLPRTPRRFLHLSSSFRNRQNTQFTHTSTPTTLAQYTHNAPSKSSHRHHQHSTGPCTASTLSKQTIHPHPPFVAAVR